MKQSLEKEQSSYYETDQSERKTSEEKTAPPTQLEFSQEIKDFTSNYCDRVLDDVEMKTIPVKKPGEITTTNVINSDIRSFESSSSTTKTTPEINPIFVKNIFKKLPIIDLDSSITIGIATRTKGKFKNFYVYVKDGEPIVKEQSIDSDNTKMILTIPEDIMIELGETSKNNICSKIKTEISNDNIDYVIHLGISLFKSGVSELKNCLE